MTIHCIITHTAISICRDTRSSTLSDIDIRDFSPFSEFSSTIDISSNACIIIYWDRSHYATKSNFVSDRLWILRQVTMRTKSVSVWLAVWLVSIGSPWLQIEVFNVTSTWCHKNWNSNCILDSPKADVDQRREFLAHMVYDTMIHASLSYVLLHFDKFEIIVMEKSPIFTKSIIHTQYYMWPNLCHIRNLRLFLKCKIFLDMVRYPIGLRSTRICFVFVCHCFGCETPLLASIFQHWLLSFSITKQSRRFWIKSKLYNWL